MGPPPVSLFCSLGSGAASSFTLASPPAAPTNLQMTKRTATTITIAWNDNSKNELGFYVERSTDGGATWTRIAQTATNVSNYQNTGLTTKTTYLYRVQAFNASGVSGYSNVKSITTL